MVEVLQDSGVIVVVGGSVGRRIGEAGKQGFSWSVKQACMAKVNAATGKGYTSRRGG